MNAPKRHHYVPKSYLEGFAEEGVKFIHVYSKSQCSFRRQLPSQVMVIGQYYRQAWAPEGVDQNVLERYLGSELEPKGLAGLKQLIANPKALDGEVVADILNYLQFQRIRVPRQADIAKRIAKSAITSAILKTRQGADALRYHEVEVQDSFRFEFMSMMQGTLSPYFSRMIWEIIEAERGSSFITSDSPVTLHNIDFIPPAEPGVALYGTKVLFPINKRFLLLMSHPEYKDKTKAASDILPINLEVEDGLIEIRSGEIWSASKVGIHNRIVFFLAHDLIAGESKEILVKAVG